MRYWLPLRKLLKWVSNYCFEEKILDYLYPDDCVITFKEDK